MQYLVKRVGLGLDEYGIVNARAVKRQRLLASELQAEGEEGDAEESAATLPVSIEMVSGLLCGVEWTSFPEGPNITWHCHGGLRLHHCRNTSIDGIHLITILRGRATP